MIRIIARLDIKGPNVVKGVNLEGLRVVGRPEILAPYYYADGADEIIYIDTVASLYGRNNLEEVVRKAAQSIFIPLTVGGGIRTVSDIRNLLLQGADKVAINTAAINNPSLIQEAVKTFGSQCIVVSIQAKYREGGWYECLTDNAREPTGLDVFEWAKRAEDLGAGELLLTAVDRDGTGRGYDLELVSKVSRMVDIPVIASAGAGKAEDVKNVIIDGHADAVCCASLFHYASLNIAEKAEYSEEVNIDFLSNRLPIAIHQRKRIEPVSISGLKKYLIDSGINCRIQKSYQELPI